MSDEPTPTPDGVRERRRQLKKPHGRLAKERAAWARWMPRVRRAFRAADQIDRRITRIER